MGMGELRGCNDDENKPPLLLSLSKNTAKSTKWRVTVFREWTSARNCPDDILERPEASILDFQLNRFVAEVRRSAFTCRCCIIGPICLLAVPLHLPLAPLHEHQHLRSRTKASLGIYALAAPLGARTAVGYLCELSKKWRRPYTLAYFRGTRCLEPGFCRVYPEIHSNIIHTPSGYTFGPFSLFQRLGYDI